MAVPFGIAVGMIISRVAANKGLFLFGGCIVGVLVGHVVIRLIYRCELKTILDGKLAGIFSIAAAVLILAGLTGQAMIAGFRRKGTLQPCL